MSEGLPKYPLMQETRSTRVQRGNERRPCEQITIRVGMPHFQDASPARAGSHLLAMPEEA